MSISLVCSPILNFVPTISIGTKFKISYDIDWLQDNLKVQIYTFYQISTIYNINKEKIHFLMKEK